MKGPCLLFSRFAIILTGKRKLVVLLKMSNDTSCSVTFPHSVVGWSAVCDCVFS